MQYQHRSGPEMGSGQLKILVCTYHELFNAKLQNLDQSVDVVTVDIVIHDQALKWAVRWKSGEILKCTSSRTPLTKSYSVV